MMSRGICCVVVLGAAGILACGSSDSDFDPTGEGSGRLLPTRDPTAATFTTADPEEQPPMTIGDSPSPLTSGGSESSGGDPTGTDTDATLGDYGRCPCAVDELCVVPGTAVGTYCAASCSDTLPCPPASDGVAFPVCALGVAGEPPERCALQCTLGGTDCPLGMNCENIGMIAVCTWL